MGFPPRHFTTAFSYPVMALNREEKRENAFRKLQTPGIIDYDPAEYDFLSLFREMFDGYDGDMDHLHSAYPELIAEYSEHFDAFKACSTHFHRKHYDSPAYPRF